MLNKDGHQAQNWNPSARALGGAARAWSGSLGVIPTTQARITNCGTSVRTSCAGQGGSSRASSYFFRRAFQMLASVSVIGGTAFACRGKDRDSCNTGQHIYRSLHGLHANVAWSFSADVYARDRSAQEWARGPAEFYQSTPPRPLVDASELGRRSILSNTRRWRRADPANRASSTTSGHVALSASLTMREAKLVHQFRLRLPRG